MAKEGSMGIDHSLLRNHEGETPTKNGAADARSEPKGEAGKGMRPVMKPGKSHD